MTQPLKIEPWKGIGLLSSKKSLLKIVLFLSHFCIDGDLNSFFFQGVMSKACAWNTLEKQLLDEDYRNNLLINLPINGDAFTTFDDDTLGERLIQTNNQLNSSAQTFLEKQGKNLDKSSFQSLYLQHEDIYNGVKSNFFDQLPSVISKIKSFGMSSKRTRTVDFMNFVMDEATHLKNFPKPVDSSLARFVVAKHDAYIPRDNVMSVCNIWPDSTVEYINCGHVAASLNHQDVFRRAIKDTLDQL